jgi:hypothetical protein
MLIPDVQISKMECAVKMYFNIKIFTRRIIHIQNTAGNLRKI